ncbi:hypothetical protein BDR04DRAFT_169966 [Suillus decipiens]|nr:hypothetical protein BDR04DRAFT_169966 [Suillus decipiens]
MKKVVVQISALIQASGCRFFEQVPVINNAHSGGLVGHQGQRAYRRSWDYYDLCHWRAYLAPSANRTHGVRPLGQSWHVNHASKLWLHTSVMRARKEKKATSEIEARKRQYKLEARK